MNGAPLPSRIGTSRLSISMIGIVDAHAVENAQQMLGRGDQNALPHQAGGVADARHVLITGGNAEVLKIGAFERRYPWMAARALPAYVTGTPL